MLLLRVQDQERPAEIFQFQVIILCGCCGWETIPLLCSAAGHWELENTSKRLKDGTSFSFRISWPLSVCHAVFIPSWCLHNLILSVKRTETRKDRTAVYCFTNENFTHISVREWMGPNTLCFTSRSGQTVFLKTAISMTKCYFNKTQVFFDELVNCIQ